MRSAESNNGRIVDPALDGAFTSCPVLGFEIYAGEISGAAETVVERALSGRGGYACLTGVHGITVARRDEVHFDALQAAWVNFPDGAPIAWRQKLAGARDAHRIAGPDLMPEVVRQGQARGVRHYLLGSTEDTLERLSRTLQGKYPRAQVVGAFSPPFRAVDDVEQGEMLEAVRATNPHIVWVGLGAPKQDLWMRRYAEQLSPALCIGVGAAFDFISGQKRRAPEWMRRSGLEWVHRVSQEPRRLAPRYLQANSRFVADNTRDLAHRIRSREKVEQ